jgi:hypothetical protein
METQITLGTCESQLRYSTEYKKTKFKTNEAKVGFLVTPLTDKGAAWAQATIQQVLELRERFYDFSKQFVAIFFDRTLTQKRKRRYCQ